MHTGWVQTYSIRPHSTEADASPAFAEAAAGADPELGFLVGVPGEAGLEGVVFIQVPFGAFQWTSTGPESPDVIPAHMQELCKCSTRVDPPSTEGQEGADRCKTW